LIKKQIKVSHNYITWGLLIFLSFGLLSFIKAEEVGWAIRKLLVFLSIFPLYFVFSSTFGKKDFPKISLALVSSGTIVAGLGILQFLSQFIMGPNAVFNFWSKYLARFFLGEAFSQAVIANPSWWVNIGGHTFLRATSLFPDPHMLSFFLGIILPLFIPLILKEKRTRTKFLYVFMAIIAIVALALTFSRGGYLGFLVAILFALIFFYKHLSKKQKISIVFALLLILMVVLFSPIRDRLLSSFNLKEGSVSGRLEIWQQAFSVWLKNFWLGVGIGNYSYYLNPLYSYRLPVYAHNTYLDIAVEMGIFGLLAWLSIFVYAILKLLRSLKIESVALISSLAYFLVHAFFDTPLYSPQILPLLMIVLAMVSILMKRPKDSIDIY
jgi:O-antigen ligase